VTLILALLSVQTARSANDGLARTPPMGWRSWNFYACEIDHSVFERQVDALSDRSRLVDGSPTSLADLGYSTVGIDDCWQDCTSPLSLNGSYHSASGEPLVDVTRFPDGLRGLSDYAAARGIGLGWYGNNCPETHGPGRGPKYCSEHGKLAPDWAPALAGDVKALLAANFSAVKLDNPGCGANSDLVAYYATVNGENGSVVLENCHYNTTFPHWVDRPGGELACPMHLYRVSNDIKANWGSVMGNAAATAPFADAVHPMSQPGCWAYPDMLEIGVQGQNGQSEGGLSAAEERTHLGLWQVLSSPLTLSFDAGNRTLMDELWPLLTNTEALAVSQSWFGHPGSLAAQDTDNAGKAWQAWSKPQEKGAVAVLLISRALDMGTVGSLPAIDLSLRMSDYVDTSGGAPTVRDVWNRGDIDATTVAVDGVLHFPAVPAHDSVFLVLTPNHSSHQII
jgi:alpha-galactosidase